VGNGDELSVKSEDELRASLELVRLKTRLATELAGVPHLRHISARLQRDVGLPSLLLETLQSAVEISGADFGNVQLLDSESGSLKIVAQRGFKDGFLDYFNQVHSGQFGCGAAMQRQARVIVEDVASDPIFQATEAREVMLKAEARACQSTPLVNRERKVIGWCPHISARSRDSRRASCACWIC
jgi:GAF domain-containing protein